MRYFISEALEEDNIPVIKGNELENDNEIEINTMSKWFQFEWR